MSTDFQYDINTVSQDLRIRSEILQKLIISFSKTLSDKIDQLNTLVPQNHTEQIRAIMHEIKGTSGNLRLTNIYRATDKMHVAVKSGEEESVIVGYFQEFKNEVAQFLQYVNKLSGFA